MLPPELKAYLDECRLKSIPFASVKPQLEISGWNPVAIANAATYYELPSSDTPPVTQPVPESVIPAVHTLSPSASSGHSKPSFRIFLVVFLGLFLLFSGFGVSAYFVATERLSLPDSGFKTALTSLAFKIPFIPKTPKYIINSALLAHQQLSRHSFTVSVKSASPVYTRALSGSDLDLQVKGYVDYSDQTTPKFSLSADIGQDFSLVALKNSAKFYYKLTKIPEPVSTLFQLDSEKLSLLANNWIVSEPTSSVSIGISASDPSHQAALTRLQQITNQSFYPLVASSQETEAGVALYKLDFHPTPAQFDALYLQILDVLSSLQADPLTSFPPGSSPSSRFQDFQLTLYVRASDYYISKGILNIAVRNDFPPFSVESIGSSSDSQSDQPLTFQIAIQFADYGQSYSIVEPAQALTVKEMYQQLFASTMESALDPTITLAKANNAKRRSDIRILDNALNQYILDHHNVLPLGITATPRDLGSGGADICQSLVPDYLLRLPIDPFYGQSAVFESCASSQTGYTLQKDAQGNYLISAPHAELGEIITSALKP